MEHSNILRKFPSNVFSASEAARFGLTRYLLNKLEREGEIEKLCRGIYRLGGGDISDEDSYKAATLRVGEPSAICLLSALSYYNLTDTIPKKTWIMVPATKRTSYDDLKVLRSRKPNWRTGIEKGKGYSITSIERTIVDCLVLRSRLGSTLGIEALRRALQHKGTSLGKVIEMAKALGVLHRIQPYVEALA